ncbi:hypothetical protein Ahy_B02g058809 isoform B [Arachis hypogaea]|uniref:Uncharacterized protein n=1 Tax=Arachis hypogaea TaxID=3818 RepID=A0A445AFG5_ARAHY|nr:hypothetical protein Ahy_B02g058809 isoform B [Arachis hypogaea]
MRWTRECCVVQGDVGNVGPRDTAVVDVVSQLVQVAGIMLIMENIANLRVYYNGEVIQNTHEGVTFVCECLLSFAIPCTMSFVELQNGLCNNIQSHISKRVSNILYRNLVQVFGGLIQFQMMPITDDANMQ